MLNAMSTPKPWLLYCRVSTTDQADGGVSLDQQQRAVEAYATAKGWAPVEVIIDPGCSAKDLRRPGAQRILAAMRARSAAGVIVWRLDRLTRSLKDLIDLLELAGDHFGIVSVTESLDTSTPMGRFVVNMLGSIAQWERETIAARVTAAKRHTRDAGFFTGGVPPPGTKSIQDGHRRRLVPTEHGPAIAQIFSEIIAGKSLNAVCDYMRASGVPSNSKLGWNIGSIYRLIRSPLAVPVLVDEATRQRALAALTSHAVGPGKHGTTGPSPRATRQSIIASLVRCPTCGMGMTQAAAHGRNGRHYYFRCTNKAKRVCSQKDLAVVQIEIDVVSGVRDLLRDGQYRNAVKESLAGAVSRADAAKSERAKLSAERERTDARIAELALHGTPRDPGYMAALRHLGAELDRIEKRLAELEGLRAAADVDVGNLDMALREVEAGAEALAGDNPDLQRSVIRGLVESVTPKPEGVEVLLYPPPGFDGKAKMVGQPGFEPRTERL